MGFDARMIKIPDGHPPYRGQSSTALMIQHGVRRQFTSMGHAMSPEFLLANGRRADVIALCHAGLPTIYQIKSPLILQPGPAVLGDGFEALRTVLACVETGSASAGDKPARV